MGILKNEVSRQFIAVPDDRKAQIVYKWPEDIFPDFVQDPAEL